MLKQNLSYWLRPGTLSPSVHGTVHRRLRGLPHQHQSISRSLWWYGLQSRNPAFWRGSGVFQETPFGQLRGSELPLQGRLDKVSSPVYSSFSGFLESDIKNILADSVEEKTLANKMSLEVDLMATCWNNCIPAYVSSSWLKNLRNRLSFSGCEAFGGFLGVNWSLGGQDNSGFSFHWVNVPTPSNSPKQSCVTEKLMFYSWFVNSRVDYLNFFYCNFYGLTLHSHCASHSKTAWKVLH